MNFYRVQEANIGHMYCEGTRINYVWIVDAYQPRFTLVPPSNIHHKNPSAKKNHQAGNFPAPSHKILFVLRQISVNKWIDTNPIILKVPDQDTDKMAF